MNLVHMVIDESAALGHMEAIDDMLSMGRGYGIRVHLFFQNTAQLMRCYPDGQHQFVMGTTTNIFFGAHDWITCEEISKRSGSQTVIADSGGDGESVSHQQPDNGGAGNTSWSTNRSRNWAFAAKPLIRPEQVAALPARAAITFAPGVGRPILSWLTLTHESRPPPTRLERTWERAKLLGVSLLLTGAALLVTLSATEYERSPRQRSPPAPQSNKALPPASKVRT